MGIVTMKHFYVIVNPDKKQAGETAQEIRQYLEDRGATCQVGKADPENCQGCRYTDSSLVPGHIQCAITLGGDGTLIQAARDLKGRRIPLVGINLGTLGYLTQVSKSEDIHSALDALLADDFQLEERMMLAGRAYRDGRLVYEDIALNEIVLTRKDLPKMLKLRIFVDGEFLNQYTADGIIIATPTGSTAYNLSAGGPIVVPDSSMVILTPICSHVLNARSIVLPAEGVIGIQVLGDDVRTQAAVFDGDTDTQLLSGDCMEITKSQVSTVLIKLNNISFLDNLRYKLAGV